MCGKAASSLKRTRGSCNKKQRQDATVVSLNEPTVKGVSKPEAGGLNLLFTKVLMLFRNYCQDHL